MDKRKVLVVEDEEALRTALVVKLKYGGYETIIAENGEDGLKQALEKHPDIILLDLVMPIMDGMSMMAKLRQDPWGQKVPVIVLTNVSPDNVKQIDEILTTHPAYYLIKSNSPLEDILLKIKEVLPN